MRLEEIIARSSKVTSIKLEALRESQLRTDQKLAETDDRLKALVNRVDRFSRQRLPTGSPKTRDYGCLIQ